MLFGHDAENSFDTLTKRNNFEHDQKVLRIQFPSDLPANMGTTESGLTLHINCLFQDGLKNEKLFSIQFDNIFWGKRALF